MNITEPITLPCGLTLENRIAKAAMTENLADLNNNPNEKILELYRRFAAGGSGLLITGNVMIDRSALAEPRNIVVEDESSLDLLAEWAKKVQNYGTKIFMQLNHPGRQSPAFLSKRPVAPSDVGLDTWNNLAFNRPRALTHDEIENLIASFARSALIAQKAGFDGVQIYGSHGYLISQFLSPLSNLRTDVWGGSLENRMRFLVRVYEAIRESVGSAFPVALKINSADFERGGFSNEESLFVIEKLASLGLDLIEISGGTFEKAAMTGVNLRASTRRREAYFIEFSQWVKSKVSIPVMLTGGFRTGAAINSALRENIIDIVGLARPLAQNPDFALELIMNSNAESKISPIRTGIECIDNIGFLEIGWYELQMARIADGKSPDPDLNAWQAIAELFLKNGIDAFLKKRA